MKRKAAVLNVFWPLIVCLCVVTGCASLGTYNPATGRSEFIFISTPEEISLGSSIHQQLAQKFTMPLYTERAARLRQIGARVATVSDRRDYAYQFFLVEQDEMNAFTIPGGRVYMFSGLMNKLETDDEIASVLAHEIGHCAARHTVKKFQASLGYNLISGIILGQVGEEARQLASTSTGAVMNVVFSAYGRQDEYEADHLGLKYLRLAGYDPMAGIRILQLLQRESKDQGRDLLMLRSHPYLADRIRALEREMADDKSGQDVDEPLD